MSLFGALFTGVSGLSAQSQSTAMIANNIANVDTVGFKSSDAAFYSLVTSANANSAYSPGTVATNRVQNVSQQGSIQQTSSSTDAAVSGDGFFAVKRDTSSGQGFLYTRSGSFSEDSAGLLRNSAGFVLYGWPLDSAGALPSNQGDLASLKPVDVAFLGGLTRPTSTADISLNLNASEKDQTIAGAQTSAASFSRGLTVYDSLGGADVLTFQLTKTYGPQATDAGTKTGLSTTTNLITGLGLTAGDEFSLDVDGSGSPQTFAITDATHPAPSGAIGVSTVGDIVNGINNLSINTPVPKVDAFIGSNGELVIQRADFTGGTTQSIQLANVTNSYTSQASSALTSLGLTVGSFTSNDLTHEAATATGAITGLATTTTMASLGYSVGDTIKIALDGSTTPTTYTVGSGDKISNLLSALNAVTGVTASLNASGQLMVSHDGVGSASFTMSGTGDLSKIGLSATTYKSPGPFSNGTAADSPAYSSGNFPTLQNLPGSTNYNNRGWWQMKVTKPDGSTQSEGMVNFNADGSINAVSDASGKVNVALNQIDWQNGSSKQNVTVDISKFTQFSGDYNVISTNQNGAALGLRTGVEITRDGYVVAQFSNGASTNLYKLPLVTFANEDGLTEESGTAYSKNDASGEENLREAGKGGAGFLSPDSVESSNVDLADEFAKLIVSQRAYSANTKVITTVDQMTQDLLQLR